MTVADHVTVVSHVIFLDLDRHGDSIGRRSADIVQWNFGKPLTFRLSFLCPPLHPKGGHIVITSGVVRLSSVRPSSICRPSVYVTLSNETKFFHFPLT